MMDREEQYRVMLCTLALAALVAAFVAAAKLAARW